MRVGIITIGNELLSGFTVDRNAAWIGQQLLSSGIKVNVHHTIPDDFGVIYDTLEYQFREWRCDQIIVTGGLGPTVDDITVSSFLEYFDDSHEFDKEYWEILSERFKRLNFKMPNLNKNQAYKSKRGIMIPNLVGTARGLHYTKKHDSVLKSVKGLITGDKNRVNFFALPGVPKEMKSMFTNYVLPEIEKSILEYSLKARDGKLAIEDMQGGTFTISNGGIFGSLLSTPILNAPQTAILGMHAIQDRPVAIEGEVVIRPMMYLAMSYDHRLLDGKEAVSFLVSIKEQLESPERLLLNL